MAAKFVVVLVAMVAAGHCSVVPAAKVDTDYSSFAYDVADPNTGDYKSQVETRVGGTVSGQYSLIDPDGTKRTVDYTADDVNGFNAVVRKDPIVAAPVVAAPAVTAPVVSAPAAAPAVVAARVAAPVKPIPVPVYVDYPSVATLSYSSGPVYQAYPSVYSAKPVVSAYPYDYSSLYY